MFEQAVGYKNDARFVAIFWECESDALGFSDSKFSSGLIDYQGWMLFHKHPLVRLHFLEYDFGSSSYEAIHWLLLDRQSRRFYAGEKGAVASFLESEAFPVGKPARKDSSVLVNQVNYLLDRVDEFRKVGVAPDELIKSLQEKKAVRDNLRTWLGRLG